MQRTAPRVARYFVAAQLAELSFCSCVASRALVDFGDGRAQELAFTGEGPNGWATAAVQCIDIAEGNPSVNAGGDYERNENTGHHALPRAQAPPHRFDATAHLPARLREFKAHAAGNDREPRP